VIDGELFGIDHDLTMQSMVTAGHLDFNGFSDQAAS
jgi:hypothetical protein